ncbi:NXPE family member 3-like [Apostichopus japonicus]|uniref:NXPE family member 3-like n=1 Tax=Stichopus japonicus TaxID=307972 RepID=UPI003AB3C6D9
MAMTISFIIILLEWNGLFETDHLMLPAIRPATVSFDYTIQRRTHKVATESVHPCTPPWRSSDNCTHQQVLGGDVDKQVLPNVKFDQTTSPYFTTVNVMERKTVYHINDKLVIKIQARDWRNEPKLYGGDFFRFKIFSMNPYSASREDEMTDFQNGTYFVYFTLRWSGKVNISVTLIHPVELLPQMTLTLSGKVGLNVTFVGQFVAGNVTEDVICRYAELEWPFCNLSNPRTHGPWYCQKPKDPRLKCKDWKYHKMYKGTFLKLEENLSPLSKSLLMKSHMVKIPANLPVLVEDVLKLNLPIEDKRRMELSYCAMNGTPAGMHTSGHFFQNKWYPNDCRVVDFSVDTGMKCLSHKTIVYHSTIRQVFEYVKDYYKRYLVQLPLPEGAIKGHGPVELKSVKDKILIKYHFHGLPSSGTGLVLRTDYIEYIVDRINSRKDGCEVVYVLSLWAHFIATGKIFYVRRLLAIKQAVTAFLDRCPRSKVIIKGANTKDHPTIWIAIVSSEWNIVQHELELRKIFRDEKRVGFIDAFDITRVQPFKDQVHPDRKRF